MLLLTTVDEPRLAHINLWTQKHRKDFSLAVLTAQVPALAIMTYSKCSTFNIILVALSILPAFVNGYDCSSISSSDSCSDESSVIGYSQCMLKRYSISAFIQCASQSDAADFSATTNDDGGSTDITATEVLTNALTPNGIPLAGCGDVPLAGNILKTANQHGSVNFAKFLCDQYHPLNRGLCRLRNCLVRVF